MGFMAVAYPEIEKKDFDWIQSIRNAHDPNYAVIAPHFSLVFPVTNIDSRDFCQHCNKICGAIPKIDFVIGRAIVHRDCDADDRYVFFTPDEGNSEIILLHDRLYTGILEKELRSDIKYIPHITVARTVDESLCKQLTDATNRTGINITGRITAVDIISIKEDCVFSIAKIPLMGD